MSITGTVFSTITHFVEKGGEVAFFVLTFLDSTVLPIPNETFMPFAGAAIASGRFNFVVILLISVIGGIGGALTSYAIGYYGTEPFVKKYGKALGIKMADIEKTHALFAKYGDKIILGSRFIPVVRQFISLPAGAAKMKLWKFILYTMIGSSIWNTLILYLGYTLGANSEKLKAYTGFFDRFAIALFLLSLVFLWYRVKRKKIKYQRNKTLIKNV